MILKKISRFYQIISVIILAILSSVDAWSQRNSMPRSYEISGLQSGEEVGTSVFYGFICVIVGIVIQKVSSTTDKNGKETTSGFIILSILFFILAFILFMPLFAWIEFAAMGIMGIILCIGIVAFICTLIFGWLKK